MFEAFEAFEAFRAFRAFVRDSYAPFALNAPYAFALVMHRPWVRR